jgi:hypothetical protein
MAGINRKFGEIPSVNDFDRGDGIAAVGDCKFEVFLSTAAGSTTVSIDYGPGTGTISSSGTLVNGSGTIFLREASTERALVVGGESRVIVGVINDSTLVLGSPFPFPLADEAYSISPTVFKPGDGGKIIGIFGAGSSGTIVPIITMPQTAEASISNEWQWLNIYGTLNIAVMDTLGALSARFTVTCRAGNIEWELYGANSPDFAAETLVYSSTVTIVDGEKGGRDIYTEATTPPFRYYRSRYRGAVAGVRAEGYGCMACYGYLHHTTIASVTSAIRAEMAAPAAITIAHAQSYWGWHEDKAITNGLQALKSVVRGSDRGGALLIPGAYLTSQTIKVPNKVKLVGDGLVSTIVPDPGVFASVSIDGGPYGIPVTGPIVTQIGEDDDSFGAYSTRIESVHIYCNEMPDSIAVYSQWCQESSGLSHVHVTRFGQKGIFFNGFGCQNWSMQDIGANAAGNSLGDDDAVAIHLYRSVSRNSITGASISGSSAISGYGDAVRLEESTVTIDYLHTESSYNALKATDSLIVLGTHITGPGVIRSNVFSPGNSIRLWRPGDHVYIEEYDKNYAGFDQGMLCYGSEVHRFIGRSGQGGDVINFQNQGRTVRVNRQGYLELDGGGRRDSPNIILIGSGPNLGGGNQGGWMTVNAQFGANGKFIQVSDKHTCSASSATDKLTLTYDWPTDGRLRTDYLGEHWNWTLADGYIFYAVGTDGADEDLPTGLVSGTPYYVVGSDPATKTFSLSLTEAGSPIDLTTDSAEMYVTKWPYAGYYRMGTDYFEFRRGRANLTTDIGDITNPGEMILQARADYGCHFSRLFFYAGDGYEQRIGNPFGVNRARLSHGASSQSELRIERSTDSEATWTEGYVFHLELGHLIIPSALFVGGQRFAGDYAGNGSPNGAVTAFKGSTYRDGTNGNFYVKLTGSGATNTGWVSVSDVFWTAIDAHNINTVYRVHIEDTTNSRPLGITIVDTSHIDQAATPLITANAFVVDYRGRVRARSMAVDATPSTTDGYLQVNAFLGIGSGATSPTGSEQLRNSGASRLEGAVALPGLSSASRALVANASKEIEASSVTATELGYLSGVTSALQTQIANLQSQITSLSSLYSSLASAYNSHTHPPATDGPDPTV